MSDLSKRLVIMAGMIEMCERIGYGQDSAIMREAANEIDALRARIAELETDNNLMRELIALPQPVPDGWKLVPVEPTQEMESDAAFNLWAEFGIEFTQANRDFALRSYYWIVKSAAAPEVKE